MHRLLIATGIAVTLLLGGVVVADAAPRTGSCVTIDEFAQIRMGMSKAEVTKVFGAKGVRKSVAADKQGHTNEVRAYKVCRMAAAKVDVTFASGQDLPGPQVGWAKTKSWVQRWERPQTAPLPVG